MSAPIRSHSLDGSHTYVITTDNLYHHFPRHYHDTYSIALLTHGAKDFRTNSTRHTLDSTNMVTMNPGEIHYGNSINEEGWRQLVILFDSHSGRRFAEENSVKKKELIFDSIVKTDRQLRADVVKLCRGAVNAESDMEREHLCEMLMAALFSGEKMLNATPPKSDRAGIRKVIELMNDEPDEKHTLEDLARMAGMSKFHFLRSFRHSTGVTPHAYLNLVRIEIARKLILTTDISLSEIALSCGFSDQAHFTRSYKKIYGTPPGAIVRK